jgi:geranylgeranylglycerol-phosphate geranylgeranyltransferase
MFENVDAFAYPVINNKLTDVKRKLTGTFKIIRPNNIIPTTLLCATGGWISNPSFIGLFKTPTFYISTLVTLLVMSASMVINDIFDYPVDKINSPTRPLITGELSIKEAIGLTVGCFLSAEVLGFFYLPKNVLSILHIAILNAVLYTPVLKRMSFIKNVSCSTMIAFAPIFTGLSVMSQNANIMLLSTLVRLVFFGSLQNELLMDICDMEGDQENRIRTIPILIGKERTLHGIIRMFLFNIITISIDIGRAFGARMGGVFAFIYAKGFYDLIKIPEYGFSKEYIKYTIITSMYPFMQSLVYFIALSFCDRYF